jgi:hypothetical protein
MQHLGQGCRRSAKSVWVTPHLSWALASRGSAYTRVDLVSGNFVAVNGCENGRHEMWSDAPFGVTVLGWGLNASQGFTTTYVSYAYPAGASVRSINGDVVRVG